MTLGKSTQNRAPEPSHALGLPGCAPVEDEWVAAFRVAPLSQEHV